MASADLTGVDQKIRWAQRHLADLKEAIGETLKTHPYRFVGQRDPQTGYYVIRIHDLPPVDPAWSLRLGDVVHNFRSALDHLAWQLVILDGGIPTDRTQFPIHESPFDRKGRWVTAQLQPAVSDCRILDALGEVQPYVLPDLGQSRGFCDPHENSLWRLHRLDIIDKHRLLLVVRCALDVDQMWWGLPGGVDPPKLKLSTAPLEEGDAVAWFDFGDQEPPPDFDPHPGIAITLRESDLADVALVPLERVLDSLSWWVEWHIVGMQFRHLFP